MKKIVGAIGKVTLIEIIISILLVFVMAFIMLKLMPGESIIRLFAIFIYGVSTFIGGILIGKVMENNKFFWGGLCGLIYFSIILIIGFAGKGGINVNSTGILPLIISSIVPGMIGGMIS